MGEDEGQARSGDQGSSFEASPAAGHRAPGGSPAHSIPLGTTATQRRATRGLLKRMWGGCELDPRAPGPEFSPPWPPCLVMQKDGSSRPQQGLLALVDKGQVRR